MPLNRSWLGTVDLSVIRLLLVFILSRALNFFFSLAFTLSFVYVCTCHKDAWKSCIIYGCSGDVGKPPVNDLC